MESYHLRLRHKNNYNFAGVKSTNYPSKLNLVLIFISAIIPITPELQRIVPNPIKVAIIICWYADIILYERNKFHGIQKNFVIIVTLWMMYEIVQFILGLSHAGVGNYYIKMSYFDIVIKAVYVTKYYSDRQKNTLFRLIQFTIISNVCYNIYVSLIFPEVYDLSDEKKLELIGFNIPTAIFYNMLAFFIGISFVDIFRNKKLYIKIIDVFGIFACYYFMLTCEPRATSLTFSIILIIGAWYIYSGNKRNNIIIILLFCMVMIVLLINLDYIISLLPDRISVRYLSLLGKSGGDERTLGRFSLMMNSLCTFVNHPIFGVGYYTDKEYTNIIGQHALIPDFLGCFGIIGLIFLIYYYRKIKQLIINKINGIKYHKYAIWVFVVYILYSFNSNTFFPAVAVSAFLMLSCENLRRINN